MGHILIIAEAGVNHNGDPDTAMKMVREAKRCGADIVKFQTFDPRKLASRHAGMAEYQKNNTGTDETQEKMLEKLALNHDDFRILARYCDEVGIRFLSTPFETDSIVFLDGLQDIWKVPSGEITNYPYLVKIARTNKDVILSTGMSTMEDVEEAVRVLRDNGSKEITLLHCTTDYPTAMEDVNLKAMLALKEHFSCRVGYSDHTLGIEVPVAAAALGAEVIEKHFTLDRSMDGPDHKASLEPDELKSMINAIRNVEKAMGDGIKKPSVSEMKNIEIARKSIVASRHINRGEILTEDNLTTKRPGNGISPMRWNEIIGTAAVRDFEEDDLLEV
ncbi:MAG: N-acetylneuraminate synthase [Lachnospiraceae bacterium]|nr:N-acetylneuraminate synthase [Lachnospiraceae bacterium]